MLLKIIGDGLEEIWFISHFHKKDAIKFCENFNERRKKPIKLKITGEIGWISLNGFKNKLIQNKDIRRNRWWKNNSQEIDS